MERFPNGEDPYPKVCLHSLFYEVSHTVIPDRSLAFSIYMGIML